MTRKLISPETLREIIIEKENELISLLSKGYSPTNIVLSNLSDEIIILKKKLNSFN
jgi:hypothetical protein